MGMRKKINRATAIKRVAAKVHRDKAKLKRKAKAKTPGQKLHDAMHGRA